MRKLQSQGVHHITIVGADRQTSIDFWEGVLGMPFVFEQPNLDNAAESHLYFDPGDGRLITVFTNEDRAPDQSRVSREPGNDQTGRVRLESRADGTRLHFEERYHLTSAPWKWFEGPIYRFINRQNEASMQRLSEWLSHHPEYRPELAGRS